jgi:hypothetical protein
MTNLLSALFLGAWCWLGILAAAGHAWAAHGFYARLFLLLAYCAGVLLAGGAK